MVDGIVVGDDGRPRCWWGDAPADYREYHDEEWGRVVRDDRGLFERLSLEAFQSGLSWLVILRKREAFRAAFAGFDPDRVARFGPADVARLLGDPSIVRNRAKIEATIANARAIEVMAGAGESLGDLLWSFAPPPAPRPPSRDAVPARTGASTAMSRDLRARGFRFIGPVTAYALMQATGMVDDHLGGCHVTPGRANL
jgi:DNA-3-methyladenine glycosylase I